MRMLSATAMLLPAAAMRLAAPATRLVFEPPTRSVARKHVFCGTKEALLSPGCQGLLPSGLPYLRWKYLVESAEEGMGKDGSSATWMFMAEDKKPSTIIAALLPERCSRHASPVRPHAVTALVKGTQSASLTVVLEDPSHAAGAACAIGRAFPRFTAKTTRAKNTKTEGETVSVGFATAKGVLQGEKYPYASYAAAAEGVRRAARLVDLPPDQLTTNAFVAEAEATAERLNALGKSVSCEVISGETLRERGYGYLWGVGKAAVEPPALVVLSHLPAADDARVTTCLVGKGIVYDTGGLSLKTKDGMPGMKSDMGGAAALLGAFEAAVEIGVGADKALHLVLCLAENAIGPNAVRNDDVLTGFSGLTCEINNSDAEGRLVLADGVAHATAKPALLPGLADGAQPDLVVDMATLTGAQLIATGKRHAGIVANLEDVEVAAVKAGRLSGDTVHPLPFAPEIFQSEFESKVADMKNSVKDRSNAQSSCAANFIYEHLHPEYEGGWLHVDLAGPSFIEERGTGYGVGLTLALLEVEGFEPTP